MTIDPIDEPAVIKILRRNRLLLLQREDEQLRRMAKDWLQLEKSLQDDILLLTQEVADAKLSGSIITEQLIGELERYKILQDKVKAEVLAYAQKAEKDIKQEELIYAQLGVSGAISVINSYGTGVVFDTISIDAFKDLSAMLSEGTPLNTLLKEAYPDVIDGIIKSMLEGFAKGLGPKQIALNISRAMGVGLERITLIARTEQLRAWRTSTQQQYQASGVVLYHMRVCAKDSRTCMACLAADGEIIPVDEVLSDHPRGRCTSVPVIKNVPPPTWQTGLDWFDLQSAETQKEMLGPGMYDLWKEKGFDLKELKGIHVNEIWGNSPRVRTLKEMQSVI